MDGAGSANATARGQRAPQRKPLRQQYAPFAINHQVSESPWHMALASVGPRLRLIAMLALVVLVAAAVVGLIAR